jgi:hypothetical protein
MSDEGLGQQSDGADVGQSQPRSCPAFFHHPITTGMKPGADSERKELKPRNEECGSKAVRIPVVRDLLEHGVEGPYYAPRPLITAMTVRART